MGTHWEREKEEKQRSPPLLPPQCCSLKLSKAKGQKGNTKIGQSSAADLGPRDLQISVIMPLPLGFTFLILYEEADAGICKSLGGKNKTKPNQTKPNKTSMNLEWQMLLFFHLQISNCSHILITQQPDQLHILQLLLVVFAWIFTQQPELNRFLLIHDLYISRSPLILLTEPRVLTIQPVQHQYLKISTSRRAIDIYM
jgi:hypothetical protein